MTLDSFGEPDRIALELGRIAIAAGRLLAAVADRGAGRQAKGDGSPTTAADLASEHLILERLAEVFPGVPVVSEESGGDMAPGGAFFLVDPLDGTRDYLTGTGEYSVNIALVDGDRPVASAVAAPDDGAGEGRLWIAGREARVSSVADVADGRGWRAATVRRDPPDGLVALVSRRHADVETDACLAALPIGARRTASSAVKFCLIASGEADIYVRCGPTMEWDSAAGDHVLACAGGQVVGPSGGILTYGHRERGFLNGPFAAFGDPALAPMIRLPQGCVRP